MNFQFVKGGRCRLRQKPATAQNHPTTNDGYQAFISNANAMKGRPSRPALPRAPFPRVEPWLVRTLLFRTPVRALVPRSEALPARCSFDPKHRSLALKSGPCTVPPFLRSEPLPVRCYAFPSLRALARASFSSRGLVSVRQIGVCAMCKDLSYLFRLQESRAGLQHRLLATALERP